MRRASQQCSSPDRVRLLLVTGTYCVRQGGGLEFQARILDGAERTLAPRAWRRSPDYEHSRPKRSSCWRRKLRARSPSTSTSFFGGLHVVSHPPTLEAHREYRAGLETFASDYPRALTHLERAIEKDPGFLLPLVIVYFAHFNRGEFGEGGNAPGALGGPVGSPHPCGTSVGRVPASKLGIPASAGAQGPGGPGAAGSHEPGGELQSRPATSVGMNRPQGCCRRVQRGHFHGRTLRHSIGTFRHHLSRMRCTCWVSMIASCSRPNWHNSMRPRCCVFSKRRRERSWRWGVWPTWPTQSTGPCQSRRAVGPPRTPGGVMEKHGAGTPRSPSPRRITEARRTCRRVVPQSPS